MFGLNLVVGITIIFIGYNDLISSRKDLLSKNIASLAFSLSEQIKPALKFDDKETIEEIIDGTLTYPGAEFVGYGKQIPSKKIFTNSISVKEKRVQWII